MSTIKAAQITTFLIIICLCSGCASTMVHVAFSDNLCPYAGTAFDVAVISECKREAVHSGPSCYFTRVPLLILDLPLSFVVDTIFLPIDLARCKGPKVDESSNITKFTVPFKNGGLADVQYERLRQHYWSRRGWGVAGGGDSREVHAYYRAVTGTIKSPSSWFKKEFGWISEDQIPFGLAFAGNNAFIEYIQGAPLGSHESGCVEMQVKFGRYKDKRRLYKSSTYKWGATYSWDDVTRDIFEEAASSGEVVHLESTLKDLPKRDVCYWWQQKCFEQCPKEADVQFWSKRFYEYVDRPYNVDAAEKILIEHPEAIRTGPGRDAVYMIVEDLQPKRLAHSSKNMDKLLIQWLDMLLRHNPDINAIQYGSIPRTPLHAAVELGVDSSIRDKLVQHGGRILYPPCGFREAAVAKYPELGKKGIIREIGEAEGWVDDDVYQVWQEAENESHASNAAFARISRELGLSGAPNTEISQRIKSSLVIRTACYRRDQNSGREKWLVRLIHPELKSQILQYQTLKTGLSSTPP